MKLLLLLCLGLTLVCAHHEENHEVVTSNFDMSKISGEWYTILLASNVKEKIEEEGSFRVFVENIQALDNSSVFFQYHRNIDGECVELTFVCNETEEKGVYGVAYDGDNTFYLIEADYDEYLIFYGLNSNKGKEVQLIQLNARTPDVSPHLKKRFEELCQNHGIPKENILDVTNADRCLQARGSHRALASSAE